MFEPLGGAGDRDIAASQLYFGLKLETVLGEAKERISKTSLGLTKMKQYQKCLNSLMESEKEGNLIDRVSNRMFFLEQIEIIVGQTFIRNSFKWFFSGVSKQIPHPVYPEKS